MKLFGEIVFNSEYSLNIEERNISVFVDYYSSGFIIEFFVFWDLVMYWLKSSYMLLYFCFLVFYWGNEVVWRGLFWYREGFIFKLNGCGVRGKYVEEWENLKRYCKYMKLKFIMKLFLVFCFNLKFNFLIEYLFNLKFF